jgi:hypothetical protein
MVGFNKRGQFIEHTSNYRHLKSDSSALSYFGVKFGSKSRINSSCRVNLLSGLELGTFVICQSAIGVCKYCKILRLI